VNEFKITGNLINAYFVCHRKLWLYAHQFTPDPEMDLLAVGRLISEESYKRHKKEVLLDDVKIDLLVNDSNRLIACEVKKSSKKLKAAEMQLLFYMKRLKDRGLAVSGEIRIPKERKKISVELNEEVEAELTKVMKDIRVICTQETPPPVEKRGLCKKCAFFEFCFA